MFIVQSCSSAALGYQSTFSLVAPGHQSYLLSCSTRAPSASEHLLQSMSTLRKGSFAYKGSHLNADEVDLVALDEEFQTPCHVYSRSF